MPLLHRAHPTETQKKRSLKERMTIVYGFLLFILLIIIARLIDLQIVKGSEYRDLAQSQHYGGVVLPARRGEILSRNTKTNDTSILATNTTLDLVYVDPFITDDPTRVAELLADTLATEEFDALCRSGNGNCPRELVMYYAQAFDPLERVRRMQSGSLLEPLPSHIAPGASEVLSIPDLPEIRRKFARDIEGKISEKRVTFVPLKYGATKVQMQAVEDLGIQGIHINWKENLISADPEEVQQSRLTAQSQALGTILETDPVSMYVLLRSRPLRYVPVMRRVPPELSLRIKEAKLLSIKETQGRRSEVKDAGQKQEIQDPLRGVALIPEHWRFYPDATVASQVVGFLNTKNEAQYGIERTLDPLLRGQEGLISTVSDPQGGQIVTAEQTIVHPKDGETVILTIDRLVQKQVEQILSEAVERLDAESGQVIILDPFTGRIIAMANAPLFERNNYGSVYEKEPIFLYGQKVILVVVDIYHP